MSCIVIFLQVFDCLQGSGHGDGISGAGVDQGEHREVLGQSVVDGEQEAGLGVVLVQLVQHQRHGSAQQFGHGGVFHGLSSRHDVQEGRSHWENAPQVSEQLLVGLHSNEQRIRPAPGLVGHADGALQDVVGVEVGPVLLQGQQDLGFDGLLSRADEGKVVRRGLQAGPVAAVGWLGCPRPGPGGS